jgi:FkbM family methyltransferase
VQKVTLLGLIKFCKRNPTLDEDKNIVDRLLLRVCGTCSVHIHFDDDVLMYVPMFGGSYTITSYFWKRHEPYTGELFKATVNPGDVVVDLGASIGYYTLIAARLVGSSGRVYAFEPNPDIYCLLQKSVNLNKYHHVFPVQKAVGDRNGSICFFRSFFSAESSIYHHDHFKDRKPKPIEVQCVSLDSYLEEKSVDVIKMDIEGAEMAALNGMQRIIAQNDRLRLFTEFNPVALEAGGVHPEEFLRRLLVLGFRTFAILEEEKQLEEITESTQYNQYKRYLRNGECNLLCVKSGEGC